MHRRFLLPLAMIFLFVACTPTPTQPQVTFTAPQSSQVQVPSSTSLNFTETLSSPTNTPAPSPTPSETPIPSPTPSRLPPTSTPYVCRQKTGHVELSEINSSLLPEPLEYGIYLPPCYNEQVSQTYPVLYLIHGQSADNTQWERLGAPKVADTLITSGASVPFIIVMPRDRVWTEPTEDKFGDAITQELIPWVDTRYRTIPNREHRAVGGLSRGGGWAVHLGLSHPELFGAFGAHSGFVFQSDTSVVMGWLYSLSQGNAPRIYMDISTGDRAEIANSAIWLENTLTTLGIPHEWHLFLGYHEEAYWQSHVEDYLRWYTSAWSK